MNTEALQQLQEDVQELQARVVFQEDALEQLDRVVAEQDRLLLQQQKQLLLLAEKLKNMETRLPDGASTQTDERPPHY